MNGGGLLPRHLAHALGSSARRGRHQTAQLYPAKELQNALQKGGLAGAGAAGDQKQSGGCRLPDGLGLLLGIGNAAFPGNGGDLVFQVVRLREGLFAEFQQTLGAVGLRLVELRQVVHRNVLQGGPHQPPGLDQPGNARADGLRV